MITNFLNLKYPKNVGFVLIQKIFKMRNPLTCHLKDFLLSLNPYS